MPSLQNSTYAAIQSFRAHVKARLAVSTSLEEAAQAATELIITHFRDDVVLARIFVTLPYNALAEDKQGFVGKMLPNVPEAARLRPDTPVLTLIGSSGREENWNDPSRSKGHVAIPLLSKSFVEEIPMIAHLLKELGVSMDWLDPKSAGLQLRTISSISGLCYVSEASEVLDARGRKVISGQDFVSKYGVRTVFGVGSTYLDGNSLATMIVFCDKNISRLIAERFLLFISEFTSTTNALAIGHKYFATVV